MFRPRDINLHNALKLITFYFMYSFLLSSSLVIIIVSMLLFCLYPCALGRSSWSPMAAFVVDVSPTSNSGFHINLFTFCRCSVVQFYVDVQVVPTLNFSYLVLVNCGTGIT